MINLEQITKKSFQSKAKSFIIIPTQLLCDKNTTYREKSLLLAHYLHNISAEGNVSYCKTSSLMLRYNDFKTDKPSRRFLESLKKLEQKGYLHLIDQRYSFLNKELYKESLRVAIDSELFHQKYIDFKTLVTLLYVSLRKDSDINCMNYMAKNLGVDRNTLSKYLSKLNILDLIQDQGTEINGKHTKNYHIKDELKPLFFIKPPLVNKNVYNAVESNVHNSAQIYYYFKKIINRLDMQSNLKKIGRRMFTLSDIIDSKSYEVKRMINAVKTNLYFKNKLVTLEDIHDKLKEIATDLDERGVIKVFNNSHQFINFTSNLFKLSSYPLEKGLSNELLLKDIQNQVYNEKKELYSLEFIKWLATKLFREDFVIYHVNIFKNRLKDALLNEKRTGEETTYWSEDKYIDWDEVHRQEKRANNVF
jgi:hypothetical protein